MKPIYWKLSHFFRKLSYKFGDSKTIGWKVCRKIHVFFRNKANGPFNVEKLKKDLTK